MSNLFSDLTRNEDRYKRLSIISINSLIFHHFDSFDVHGMSGSVDVFYGVNESGKTTLMEVISWMIVSPPRTHKSNHIFQLFHNYSQFECSLAVKVFNLPSIIWMMTNTILVPRHGYRHLLDTAFRTNMKLNEELGFRDQNGHHVFDNDESRGLYYAAFKQNNVLNVEQLSSFSIFKELNAAKNPSLKENIEFLVSETLQLLRDVCPPTNQFGKIVHSVKNTEQLEQALKARGKNNLILINFTYQLLDLINGCKAKDIRLPIIIDDLPQTLSDDYLHLMAKVMKKASRICQIIATTADPTVAKVLDENKINIIEMEACTPAGFDT
jgi:predicted ATP-dependent endonuclease of OLD family